MTLETFFEKFDQFADSPRAVEKMRELVLELAVRGRLLPSGNLDPSAPSDPSRPFAIPHDWQWIALNQAADCRAAAKVDSASLNDSDWVLDLEDIDGGAGKVIATATFAERRSLSTKASFQKGDVLYGKLRPYLNKVVIADRPGFCTTEIIPLRPQKFAAAGYLRLFLRSPHFLRYAAAKNYGMKMPRLGTQDLESAEIPLPPLAEQKRIVAKVDELMALCDRLEAQQQERKSRECGIARASLARFSDAPTPANLDFLFHPSYAIPPADLRKSILTLAVQGKLVPQDPNDEPAETILSATHSLFERLVTAKKISQPKPLPRIEDDEMPFSLPSGWAWCRLGQIMRISSGDGLVSKDMNAGPVPVYGGNGVTGFHDAHNVAKQTLVIGRVGYYCGSIHVTPEKAWVTDNAFITTFDEKNLAIEFLNWLLKATDLRERDNATAQPVISGGKVYPTVLALPPLAEQRRIVAKVEQLMALVDALETQLAASRATAANLLSALVGELTTL